MNLPSIFEPVDLSIDGEIRYSKTQLIAYGKLCYTQAITHAVKIVEAELVDKPTKQYEIAYNYGVANTAKKIKDLLI